MEANGPEIDARLTQEAIPALPLPPAQARACGVILEFRRIAGDTLDGRPVPVLRYEVYRPMAEAQLKEIATMLGRTHGASGVTLIHRYGLIPAGETVVYVAVKAPNLAVATACLNDLIDVVQRDAPIWKSPAETGAASQA